MEEKKGSMLLKVISIIMMIGGILSAILGVVAGAGACALQVGVSTPEGAKALDDATKVTGSAAPVMGIVWAGVVFIILSAVFEIIAGATGIKNWKNAAACKKMMVFGIIVIVLSLTGNILGGIGSGNFGSYIVSIVLGLILPVLYIVGVFQLKGQE